MRIIFAIELEKYIANASIFGIIIDKLSYLKELSLVILFKIDKNLKISFYYAILFLDLAVYLKIEDSW